MTDIPSTRNTKVIHYVYWKCWRGKNSVKYLRSESRHATGFSVAFNVLVIGQSVRKWGENSEERIIST